MIDKSISVYFAFYLFKTEKATSFYKDVLKADVSAAEDLPEHGVTTVFINLPNTKLEVSIVNVLFILF